MNLQEYFVELGYDREIRNRVKFITTTNHTSLELQFFFLFTTLGTMVRFCSVRASAGFMKFLLDACARFSVENNV